MLPGNRASLHSSQNQASIWKAKFLYQPYVPMSFYSITEEAAMSDWFKNQLKQKANPQRQQLLETYSQSWGKVSWDNALTIFVQTDAFLSPWNLSSSSQHRDDGRQSDLGRSSIAWGGEGLRRRKQALIPYSHTAFSQSLCFLPSVILSLLLPLLIPVSCMFPALSKGKIQQKTSELAADWRFYNMIELSSKAALLTCGFISAVTHACNTPEICAK